MNSQLPSLALNAFKALIACICMSAGVMICHGQSVSAGVAIISSDPASFKPAIWVEDKSTAASEVVAVSGGAFQKALRLTAHVPSPQPWQIGVATPTTAPMNKGDVLWMSLDARRIESQLETGEAYADIVLLLKNKQGKEVRPLERRFTCGPDWTRTSIPFVVTDDAAAGEAKLVIRYGAAAQIFEVGGISLTNCGPDADLSKLPRAGGRYVGFADDAPWRAAAAARIEQIRKGDLSIRITDADGKPVSNAKVEIRMRRHAFPWGAAVDAKRFTGNSPEDALYRNVVEKNFTKVVFANDLKWARWIKQKPEDRQRILDALAWLKAREIPVRGHVLVWPSWQYTPPFLRDFEKDPTALRGAVSQHIAEQTAAYPKLFADWDVVNETYAHNDLLKILGRDIMVEWFRETHAALPETKLFYNDFTLFQGTSPQSPSQHYHDLVTFLLEKGAPIGGIGEQGHFNGLPTGPAEIIAALDRFAKFGLPIQITEFDIDTPDEQLQADFTRDFLTAAFSHPAVESIIHWEFWDNPEGKPQACLWRKDGTLRPAGQAWQDLVKMKFWTNVDGMTSVDGSYATRGFFGDYDVTVSHGNVSKTIRLKLQPGASTQTIALP